MSTKLRKVDDAEEAFALWKAGLLVNDCGERWAPYGRAYLHYQPVDMRRLSCYVFEEE